MVVSVGVIVLVGTVLLTRVGSGPVPFRGLRAVRIGPVDAVIDGAWGVGIVGTADWGLTTAGETQGGATVMSGIWPSVYS